MVRRFVGFTQRQCFTLGPSLSASCVFLHQIKKYPEGVKENYEEYVVEFSITVVDPAYSKLLSNPEVQQYEGVAGELREKV